MLRSRSSKRAKANSNSFGLIIVLRSPWTLKFQYDVSCSFFFDFYFVFYSFHTLHVSYYKIYKDYSRATAEPATITKRAKSFQLFIVSPRSLERPLEQPAAEVGMSGSFVKDHRVLGELRQLKEAIKL